MLLWAEVRFWTVLVRFCDVRVERRLLEGPQPALQRADLVDGLGDDLAGQRGVGGQGGVLAGAELVEPPGGAAEAARV